MIRFVHLGTQVLSEPTFAFFDTVTDQFLKFGGDHVFESVEDLREAFTHGERSARTKRVFERCLRLVPERWPEGWPQVQSPPDE